VRQHFHRCGYLRLLEVDARELDGARKGGRWILEELCEAKRLAPCVGLSECDVLAPGQKRDLLAARATRLRREEGGFSRVADVADPRARELEELRAALLEERNAIAEENRRRAAEAGGALLRNPRPLGRAEERELRAAGLSVVGDLDLRELRTARLDAIDRALDAIAREGFGDCARCRKPIGISRLRESPDSAVCASCARAAVAEVEPGTA
jgi:RNA polymerase-binding transcription factor DksA